MPTAVIYSPAYECDIGPHVFPTEKFRLTLDRLVHDGLVAADAAVEPGPAPRADLLRVHTEDYLQDLEQLRWTPRTQDSELPLTAEIVRAYVHAASGTTVAARAALAAGFGVNLGGGFHHAFADRAEGFCYLNDLAVAVRVLERDRAIRKAAIVDLDVHQGNGTARIFRDDPAVFTLSLHQAANYPEPKERSTLDVGLADGVGDAEYLATLDRALERVWAFEPEILLYQAGADPYRDDRLGGLGLTLAGLEERDRRVLEGSAQRAIPAVVTLGGGYARDVADTVSIHARTCAIALELGRTGEKPKG